MKKVLALVLGLMMALALLAGCGQTTTGSGSQAPAKDTTSASVESLKTMGDIFALEAEDASSAAYEDTYVYAFKEDGTYYRVFAGIPADVSKSIQKLDIGESDYNEKLTELVSPLKIDRCENLSEQIPSKAELDKLAGKTGEDLLKDGWTISGYDLTTPEFFMNHGPFQYNVIVDAKFEENQEIDAEQEIKTLKVKSVVFSGLNESVTDVEQEEQPDANAEDEQSDATAEAEQSEAEAETTPAEDEGADLSDADLDALMKQIADSEIQKGYEKLVPDEAFANAEVFGIDRDGDKGCAYVHLNIGEYVVVKDKAYLQSGSLAEAIIRFEYTDNGPKLTKVDWSEDGAGHDEWVQKNFPKEYLKKSNAYDVYDANGKSELVESLEDEVEKTMGVPVEKENLLEIDAQKGTYKITKTIESGDPAKSDYKFDTEAVDEGKLN